MTAKFKIAGTEMNIFSLGQRAMDMERRARCGKDIVYVKVKQGEDFCGSERSSW